jgi:hypothetical protein
MKSKALPVEPEFLGDGPQEMRFDEKKNVE